MTNLEKAILLILSEASKDDAKKTKEKTKTVIDVNDENDTDRRDVSTHRSEDKTTTRKSEKSGFKGSRGSGPSLDSFRGASVADTLSAAASAGYEGDFENDFESALANAKEDETSEEFSQRPRWTPGTEETPEPVLRFQTNQPVRLDDPGLTGRARRFKDPKAAISKILMDEFVQPAMSLGMQLLPTVFGELGRLMRQNPQAFVRQFGAALNFLREIENEWFADLLGIQDIPPRMDPPVGEERDMHKAIINVLKKYFNAVLGVASENSDNMKELLDEVRADVGDEEFSKAFFGALSDTRDVEDQAFGQLMGGLRRLS
jgi:hypothetical protein